jgi:hypothetical protein
MSLCRRVQKLAQLMTGPFVALLSKDISAELINNKTITVAHQVIDLIEKIGFIVRLSNKTAVIGDLASARPDLTGRNYKQHARPPCVHLSRQVHTV